MPQTKISTIREAKADELVKQLQDLKEEGIALRLQRSTGQLENTARLRMVRREIARIQTIISERRIKAAQSDEA